MIETQRCATVLIASSSLDKATWRPVAEELTRQCYDVVVYEADKVANGETALAICIDNDSGLQIYYDGRPLSPQTISAAWWRRPNMFAPDQPTWTRQLNMNQERRNMQASLWAAVPEDAWLNSPERIRRAEEKLGQLAVARQVGFDIPKTVVAKEWGAIHTMLPKDIIVKMSVGILHGETMQDAMQVLPTTRLTNTPNELPLGHNPFPGYWQPYVQKSREWRITVVGDQAFDAAIYTSSEAKDDWRVHQFDPSMVTFRTGKFPDDQRERCFAFLKKLGLRFGAFDFIEDPDGKITFLECNCTGQYGWLEGMLGLPIAQALASELARIAVARQSDVL